MEQLLVHLLADYTLQSDWMANNKNKRTIPCLIHVILYTTAFTLLTISWKALLVIGATHFLIDRFPIIVKSIIWSKNWVNPTFSNVPFDKCKFTGYFDNVGNDIDKNIPLQDADPVHGKARLNYVTVWLYIITDNFLHLSINFLAIKYLG